MRRGSQFLFACFSLCSCKVFGFVLLCVFCLVCAVIGWCCSGAWFLFCVYNLCRLISQFGVVWWSCGFSVRSYLFFVVYFPRRGECFRFMIFVGGPLHGVLFSYACLGVVVPASVGFINCTPRCLLGLRAVLRISAFGLILGGGRVIPRCRVLLSCALFFIAFRPAALCLLSFLVSFCVFVLAFLFRFLGLFWVVFGGACSL